MIAVAGFVAHELVNGQGILENLAATRAGVTSAKSAV
jgi:hypothetical protein